ncbi:MAG: S49 family peptidase [Magnetococcales bacterium]|nr:S49 family peptidase [Magnetococcales bacterium]
MNFLPHLAGRILGTPLLVERARLETILSVVGPRIGMETVLPLPDTPPVIRTDSPLITPDGIAVIPIHGTLAKRVGAVEAVSGLIGYAAIEELLLDAATDPEVKAILLDIDSPGGEVGGVFDLAAMIGEVRQSKPVWALADDAFSAAYMIASAAERIYVSQTAGVGAIGVVAVHVDESQRDVQEGRRYTTITAGAHKGDFSCHEPLSDEAKGRLQTEVDRLYSMFVAAVASNRGMNEAAVRATEAALFFGDNAVAAGLADRLGTIRDALAALTVSLAPPKSTTQQPITTITQKEFRMDEQIPTAEASAALPASEVAAQYTTAATATPVAPAVAAAEAHLQYQQNAQAIVDLCALADVPHLAGEFIASGKTEEQVRKALMARRENGPEIHSHIMPGDGTDARAETNLNNNPVVVACRKKAVEMMGGK